MRIDEYVALATAALRGDREYFERCIRAAAANAGGQSERQILAVLRTPPVLEPTMVWAPPAALKERTTLLPIPEDAPKLFLRPETLAGLRDIVAEHRRAPELLREGLAPARRILLHGPSGTGKTSAAAWMAYHLRMQVALADAHRLVDSYLGSSSANIGKLFDALRGYVGILFLDEVDSVGRARGDGTHGADHENSRIVNTLLALFERDIGSAVVVAATNRLDLLDTAFVHRFDTVIEFFGPTDDQVREMVLALGFRLPVALQTQLVKQAIDERWSHARLTLEVARTRKAVLLGRVRTETEA